jgi:hypothetical protein
MAESSIELPAALRTAVLMETLGTLEHERWSRWQRYLHSQCEPRDDGALTIPVELVSCWKEQMSKPYAELSEGERKAIESRCAAIYLQSQPHCASYDSMSTTRGFSVTELPPPE